MGRPKVSVKRLLRDFPAPTPQPTPCRLWQGPIDRDGYGVLGDSPKPNGVPHRKKRAHRWVYEKVYGEIPKHLARVIVIRHKCDNRLCFRLEHLEPGTVAENNRDAQERGHLGPPRLLSPSEVEQIIARRAAGETWPQIHADFPDVGLTTVRRAGQFGHGPRPEPQPKPLDRYSEWREKGPPT